MCMCTYRGRKRGPRNSDENHSHKHLSDGVSKSTNKRQEKTLKVIRVVKVP